MSARRLLLYVPQTAAAAGFVDVAAGASSTPAIAPLPGGRPAARAARERGAAAAAGDNHAQGSAAAAAVEDAVTGGRYRMPRQQPTAQSHSMLSAMMMSRCSGKPRR